MRFLSFVSYTSDTITRFLVVECSIAMWPLLLEDCAVNDVVTVVLVLLFGAPVPKQWWGFVAHHPETHDIACMFLSSQNCCICIQTISGYSLISSYEIFHKNIYLVICSWYFFGFYIQILFVTTWANVNEQSSVILSVEIECFRCCTNI